MDPNVAEHLLEKSLKVNWLFGLVYFRECSRKRGPKRFNLDKKRTFEGVREKK